MKNKLKDFADELKELLRGYTPNYDYVCVEIDNLYKKYSKDNSQEIKFGQGVNTLPNSFKVKVEDTLKKGCGECDINKPFACEDCKIAYSKKGDEE